VLVWSRCGSAELAQLSRGWPSFLGSVPARGRTPAELALAFDVSERHVRRLCAEVERRLPQVEGSVEDAVTAFLDGVELDASSRVTAEAARLVARRLDRADARSTPALAERLVSLTQSLTLEHRQPDRVDELRARHETRRLAQQLQERGA
jgi:hypothetical protein